MHKILLLTKKLEKAPRGGRELLCKLNHDALRTIYGESFLLYELQPGKVSGISAHIHTFLGHIDGLNDKSLAEALRVIRTEQVSRVFVDGSNLGGFVALLKRQIPEVEVTTFFHNVEARFFWGAWRLRKTLHALGVLLANTLAEWKSVKYSDKIVCLNERDSLLLRRFYGRGATYVTPMVLEDKYPVSFPVSAQQAPEPFALFVGGTFYANRTGITWFVREVVPRIDLPLYIVGHGFEAFRAELEIPGKVFVIGAVDSLADWYLRAQFVVAPIFDGSGMKTKVAEAFMYGKKIIGTPEAFTGYEDFIDRAGWLCKTADDFVNAITIASSEIVLSFHPELRKIYEDQFSMNSGKARLKFIIEDRADDKMP